MDKPDMNLSGSRTQRVPLLLIILLLGICAEGRAYVDPGAGSMLVQSFLGIVAAGSALAITYWRSIKAFLTRLAKPKSDNG